MAQKKTTNKGIANNTTRHTLEIKKEHLKLIQALSIYNHTTRGDILTQLLDKGLESIDKKTLTKAYKIIENQKQGKTQSIFDKD